MKTATQRIKNGDNQLKKMVKDIKIKSNQTYLKINLHKMIKGFKHKIEMI